MRKNYENALSRTEMLRESLGIDAKLDYTKTQTHIVEYSTPTALRFIKLLELLENVIIAIDTLWLNEGIDSNEKMKSEYGYQQELIKACGRIRNFTQGLSKAIKANTGIALEDDDVAAPGKTAPITTALDITEETMISAPSTDAPKKPSRRKTVNGTGSSEIPTVAIQGATT